MRLRYNNALGSLGASLSATPGPDPIIFNAPPPFATINAPDYIPLVLEPPAGSSPSAALEIVYLTSFGAGSTGGQILRGREGTASQAHQSGVVWACGPTANDFSATVLQAAPVLDVGVVGQVRAGRQLGLADFTAVGLSAPQGLWPLTDLTDASGNGRALTNKGGVLMTPSGLNGAAGSAAGWTGNTGQGLYIADVGATDPFRIRTGSWGCWFRTARRTGVQQCLVTKRAGSGNYGWELYVTTAYNCSTWISVDGTNTPTAIGVTDVCDDRWHFAVSTFDGTVFRTYVDGVLEAATALSGALFPPAGALALGIEPTDATLSAAGTNPFFGRLDEAFVTADVLSLDQIRWLYCAKLPHSLGVVPSDVMLNVRRQRKGASFAVSDFPAQPTRLYTFSAGALTDQGINGQPLTNNGAAVLVAGADGSQLSGYSFNGSSQSLTSVDTGLPSALTTRSYGCWFKTTSGASMCVMGWGGTVGTADTRLYVGAVGGAGFVATYNGSEGIAGSYVADGNWHFGVIVEDNGAVDGFKRKLYIDGRCVAGSVTLNSITLVGASGFAVGDNPGASHAWFAGQIDGPFVCAYALTQDQISLLYAKGSQVIATSVKNPGDHVEALDATSVYANFATLDTQHQLDLVVGT